MHRKVNKNRKVREFIMRYQLGGSIQQGNAAGERSGAEKRTELTRIIHELP